MIDIKELLINKKVCKECGKTFKFVTNNYPGLICSKCRLKENNKKKMRRSDLWCPNGCGRKNMVGYRTLKGYAYKCQNCNNYWKKNKLLKYWREE